MKSKEKAKELKGSNTDALKVKEKEIAEEVFWLRMKHRSGQLSNHASIPKAKKDLARIKTFIRNKEIAALKGKGEENK